MVHIALVLLAEAQVPMGEDVVRAFADFAPAAPPITVTGSTAGSRDQEVVEFAVGEGLTAFVSLMPVPVPNGEAEGAVRFSLSAIGQACGLVKALESVRRLTDKSPMTGGPWSGARCAPATSLRRTTVPNPSSEGCP